MISAAAVVGVGAIGGFVGARLAASGVDVTLCARRPFARLVVEGPDPVTIDRAAVTDPEAVDPARWVFVATKAHQAAGTAPWLDRLCGPETAAVVVLQNGIDGTAAVEARVDVPVVPAVVLCGAELVGPGHVRHLGAARLQVPADAPRVAELAELFAGTGIALEPVDDFLTEAWRKLVMNAVSNPITAITGRRLDVFRVPAVAELARQIASECVEVARAEGARLDIDDVTAIIEILASQPSDMGSSMLYDRLAGRPTEHEALTGAVVRAARRHDVAVIATEAVHALIAGASESALLPPA